MKVLMQYCSLKVVLVLVVSGISRADTLKDNKRATGPIFSRCPHGYVRHADTCYIAAHDLASWPDAVVYCSVYGAHLAYIEDAEEQIFLTSYLKSVNAGATDPLHYYWIGGTDAVFEAEWMWASIVKPVTYKNWAPGQPDNDVSHGSKHQDCLAIYGDTGQWDDGWCETQHNFVCELELNTEVDNIVG